MKITVNVNIENSKRGWAAVANHVKHDPHQKHSNKDIEPELHSLDVWGLEAKYGVRKWQEDKFGTFVKAHDEKLRKQGRREKDRYYHSVQGFLGRKNRQTAVVTFGNNESWKKLIRNFHCQKGIDYTVAHEDKGNGNVYEWYKLNPQSEKAQQLRKSIKKLFVRWRKSLNNDPVISKYMQIGRCAIHLDEHGAPHMHAEMAFCGRTKKGAPTPSMSTAITQMVAEKTGVTPKNNREAFRKFRKITDERLIESSPFIAEKTGKPYFELTRTGRDTSRDMKTYKATEDQRLADEKKLEQIKAQREVEEQRLAELQQQRQSLEEREARTKKLERENEKLKQENRGLKAFKAKVEKVEELLGAKSVEDLYYGAQQLARDVVFYVRKYLNLGVTFFVSRGKKVPNLKRWQQAYNDFDNDVAFKEPKQFIGKKQSPKVNNLGKAVVDVENAINGNAWMDDSQCIKALQKQAHEENMVKQMYQEPEPEEHDFGGPSL